MRTILLLLLCLSATFCFGQVDSLTFTLKKGNFKKWKCPLPIPATFDIKNSKRIYCLILSGKDSSFTILQLIPDYNSENHRKSDLLARLYEQYLIANDKTLSQEEKHKLFFEKDTNIFYKDSINIRYSDLSRIRFLYNEKNKTNEMLAYTAYILSGLSWGIGAIELARSNSDADNKMEPPAPAILFFSGLAGMTLTQVWLSHIYNKVIKTDKWNLVD